MTSRDCDVTANTHLTLPACVFYIVCVTEREEREREREQYTASMLASSSMPRVRDFDVLSTASKLTPSHAQEARKLLRYSTDLLACWRRRKTVKHFKDNIDNILTAYSTNIDLIPEKIYAFWGTIMAASG